MQKFNELEMGRRIYRLVTAFIEKMLLAFKVPSCGIEVYKVDTSMVSKEACDLRWLKIQKSLMICRNCGVSFINDGIS